MSLNGDETCRNPNFPPYKKAVTRDGLENTRGVCGSNNISFYRYTHPHIIK